uniref:TruB pseudouridine (psi) synthase family member 1 n=1 Tax=Paramormyrops kingsleyae TaxID=1676925 RepID=A0A3B3RIJ2_9TELE
MAAVVTGTVSQRAPLSKLQSLNGLFAVYKKQGPTSADVLNRLKEKLLQEVGEKHQNPRKRKKALLKMGHGGTLDSAASGVLGEFRSGLIWSLSDVVVVLLWGMHTRTSMVGH